MKKILFLLCGLTMLSACTGKDNVALSEMGTNPSFENLPDSEPYALSQKVSKESQKNSKSKVKKNPYNLDPLTQKLRQDLSDCGAQVKMENHQVRINIPALSVFGQNKTTIRRDFKDNLYDIAQTLKTYSQTMVRVIGYTANDGPVLKNQALSLKQAQTVADFLKSQGVKENRLLAEGKGPDDPLTTNATIQGRQQNYRIEILIVNLL